MHPIPWKYTFFNGKELGISVEGATWFLIFLKCEIKNYLKQRMTVIFKYKQNKLHIL